MNPDADRNFALSAEISEDLKCDAWALRLGTIVRTVAVLSSPALPRTILYAVLCAQTEKHTQWHLLITPLLLQWSSSDGLSWRDLIVILIQVIASFTRLCTQRQSA